MKIPPIVSLTAFALLFAAHAQAGEFLVQGTVLELTRTAVADGEARVLSVTHAPGHMGSSAHAALLAAEPPWVAPSEREARVEWFGYRLSAGAEPQPVLFLDDQGGGTLRVVAGPVSRLQVAGLAFRGQPFDDLELSFLGDGGHGAVLLGAQGKSFLLLLEVRRP